MLWCVEFAFDLNADKMTPPEESESQWSWLCSILTIQEDVSKGDIQEEERGDQHCESGRQGWSLDQRDRVQLTFAND